MARRPPTRAYLLARELGLEETTARVLPEAENFFPLFPEIEDNEFEQFFPRVDIHLQRDMAELQAAANAMQQLAGVLGNNDNVNNRENVRRAITAIGTCDGTAESTLRQWVRAIDIRSRQLARPHLLAVIDGTVKGRLQEAVEVYTQLRETAGEAREDRHWECRPAADGNPAIQGLGAYIRRSLLGDHDAANLRRELASMSQTEFESMSEYTTRFMNAANAAYPHPRDDLSEEFLTTQLLKGLADRTVAYEITMMRRPTTIAAAEIALRETLKLKGSLGLKDKPAAAALAPAEPKVENREDDDKIAKAISALSKDVARLSTKMGEYQHGVQSAQRNRGSGRGRGYINRGGYRGRGRARGNNGYSAAPRSGRNDGTCFRCHARGHYARDCTASAPVRHNRGNWQQGTGQ